MLYKCSNSYIKKVTITLHIKVRYCEIPDSSRTPAVKVYVHQ